MKMLVVVLVCVVGFVHALLALFPSFANATVSVIQHVQRGNQPYQLPPAQWLTPISTPRLVTSNRVISLSLYGKKRKYCYGALENLRRMKRWFDGWSLWIYLDDSVPTIVIERLEQEGARVLHMPRHVGSNGMFWRLLPVDDPSVSVVCVRDADSVLTKGDHEAVEEWLRDGAILHVVHNSWINFRCMMGNAWCLRSEHLRGQMKALIEMWPHSCHYGEDEDFLSSVLWPLCYPSVLDHDRCTWRRIWKPWPTRRIASNDSIGGTQASGIFDPDWEKILE